MSCCMWKDSVPDGSLKRSNFCLVCDTLTPVGQCHWRTAVAPGCSLLQSWHVQTPQYQCVHFSERHHSSSFSACKCWHQKRSTTRAGMPNRHPCFGSSSLLFSLNFLMLTKEKRWTLPLLFVYINYRMHRVWCFQLLLFSKNMLLFFWILWPVSTDLKSPGALLKHRWQKKNEASLFTVLSASNPISLHLQFPLNEPADMWTTLDTKCSKLMSQLHYNDQVDMQLCETSETNWLCLWTCTVFAGRWMSLWCLILWQLAPDVQSQDAPEKQQLIEGSLSSQPNAIIVHGLSSSIGMQMCSKVIQACDQQGIGWTKGKSAQYVLTDG